VLYIRIAVPQDSVAISRIIRGESMHFLVEPEGEDAQRFFASLEPFAIERRMEESARRYIVAEVEGKVVGMIMTRDNNYISQFFVVESYQGQGIGAKLWQFALSRAVAAGGTGQFTVDSSFIAQPVYEKLGFSAVGEPTIQNGFKFISMRRPAASAA
jgi:GNAT superfamily N-acetyltransferase